MLPLFKDGETVFYSAGDAASSFSPGDCAVYRLEGGLLLHRITETGETGAVFSNDDGLDGHFVKWENVLGEVQTSNPLKKGRAGLLFHKTMRKLRCALKRN